MTATAHGWSVEPDPDWPDRPGIAVYEHGDVILFGPVEAIDDAQDDIARCIHDAALLAEARRLIAEHHDATPEGKAEIEVALLALLTEADTDG